jgi:hypothetical protein
MVVTGIALSALAFVLLGYLVWDVYQRRGHLPELTYGGRRLRQRTLGLAWAGVLVLGFVLGLDRGIDIASRSEATYQPLEETDADFRSSRSVTIPLPFFHYTMVETVPADDRLSRFWTARLKIPGVFLVVVFVYWLAVMRWGKQQEDIGLQGARGA